MHRELWLHVLSHYSTLALKWGSLLSSVTLPRVGWPCPYNLNSDLEDLQVVVPFDVPGITALPQILKTIEPLRLKEMSSSDNKEI